ncbi:MAG: acetamidase/formamidase family protein [Anaerolineae bacterium]|nr:acetamidase/formamidase family protein [Anaerolineae bacterium]
MSTRHVLNAERRTLHGHFSRDLPPVLTIDPGDTVRFQCLDVGWGLEPHNGIDGNRREFPGRDPVLDDGHALTGPVFIRGAKPGNTLVVRVDAIEVGQWGTTMAGGWHNAWNDRLGISEEGIFHVWTFNHEAQTARNQHGQTVTLRPFMGIYGMPPAEPGVHSTVPPRATGGNIDCKELVVGSTLYLPVAVEGGLFSTGDGHAVQGDGEICVTAIECPMDRVDLTFDLLDDMPLTTPIANTPAGWVTLGFHEDLNEAMVIALEAMLALIQRLHGLSRLDALALASLTVDFRITQVVNEVRGVHAVLPHGAIR